VATPDTIGALLEDPSAAVTRQVVAALRPFAAGLGVHRLRTLLGAAQPPHIRLAAYRLLREHDVWTRLRTDLELIDDTHPGPNRPGHLGPAGSRDDILDAPG